MSGWWAEQFARFALEVTPEIGAIAVERYPRTIELSVTPAVAMEGAGISTTELDVSVLPNVSFIGDSYIKTISLDFVPAINMEAAGTSTAEFSLSVVPTIGIVGGEHYVAAFTLSLTPTIGMIAYIKQLPHPIPWTL